MSCIQTSLTSSQDVVARFTEGILRDKKHLHFTLHRFNGVAKFMGFDLKEGKSAAAGAIHQQLATVNHFQFIPWRVCSLK